MQALEKLKRLYASNKLAHFYIFQLEGQKQQSAILQNLINTFSADEESPDIMTLEPEKKVYSVEQPDFLEYMRSWEFRPTNLHYRFFIFKDAHLLSDVILNKMLKQLEEPPSWSCILFLNPSGKSLLETIESRSLKIQVPPEQTSDWDPKQGNFAAWLEHYSQFYASQFLKDSESLSDENYQDHLSQFQSDIMSSLKGNPWNLFENLKKRPQWEQVFSQLTMELVNYKNNDYQQIQHALEELKTFQTTTQIHNSRNVRIERLLRLWHRTLQANRAAQ